MQAFNAQTGYAAAASRALRIWLAFVLLLSMVSIDLARPAVTQAAPSLSVNVSASKPLLGGTSTVTVTVTNNGDAKGYNLSLDAVLSSSLADPNGQVTIGAATPAPTSVALNGTTGDTTVTFFDVVDLAPTESHSITFDADISGDISWEVLQSILIAVNAQVNTVPDNSGAWIPGAANTTAQVIPIDLVHKDANQSTSVQQATGTQTRTYSYEILVQNNYVNQSRSVVVTDTLPDGVEFLGMQGGSPALDAGFPMRDTVSGTTALQWTLGTLAPGATVPIRYDTGIRYDYYGTANGGTNRAHDDFSSTPATAAIIAHKTDFTNTAMLTSEYKGSLPTTITPTDSDTASVEGVYITIDKSGTPTSGGYGTVVDYSLTYATSQYYTADTIVLSDRLPDGMSYVAGSASVVPTTVTHNADGTTDIVWDVITPLGQTDSGTIAFQATVDTTWEQAAYAGQPIRAGDSMTNHAELAAAWYDQVKVPRAGNDILVAEVSAGLTTGLPGIDKSVWDPDSGTWTSSIDAQPGDTLLYRVRFNTTDGLTPARDDISLGYITLTDWLPPGMVYNGDANPSYDATFSVPASGSPPSINTTLPVPVSIGSLSGIQWFLGDVSADGWWETTFTATVMNVPAVVPGLKTGNHWKLTGINTFGQEYSDRDIVDLAYTEPQLVITKTHAGAPNPIVPTSVVPYQIEIDNTGTGAAEAVSISDVLPVGMRAAAPSSIVVELGPIAGPATTLTAGTDYTTSWNAGTGVLLIDLNTAVPAISTAIDAGERLRITYNATVDAGVGAYSVLANTATTTYSTAPEGVVGGRPMTPVIANDSIQLARPSIVKAAPAGPYTVGDTFRYTIDVTVPPHSVLYWPDVRDTVRTRGIAYAGNLTIATVSGAPAVAAAAATDTAVPVTTTNATSTTFRFNLQNPIDNSGSAANYVFRVSFDVLYNGVIPAGQEFFPPGANNQVVNDSVGVNWNTTQRATRGTNQTRTDGTDRVTNLDQPLIRTVKSISSTGPYAGASTVNYRVVLTNPGYSRAYDLDWQDTLPAYLGSASLTSVMRGATDVSGLVTANFAGNPLSIDFGAVSLGTTETITIDYSAIVDPNVPAATTLTNAADTDWSSLPGTPAGSRRYDDQPWESGWTDDSSSTTIDVAVPLIDKTVIGPDPARIGDIVTYNLRVTVPTETVLPGTYLMDTIARDGFTYVNGSAATSRVSGTPETSATVVSATFNDAPNPGSTLRFDLLGDVDNSNAAALVGDSPYVFDLAYEMVYDGITDSGGWDFFAPTVGDSVTDAGSLNWTVSGLPRSVTDIASVSVDQPLLELIKTEISSGPYTGGTTVDYRTVITNNGWATAYGLSWIDTLASQMSDPNLTSITHSALGDISASVIADFASSEDTATIDFAAITLAPGQSITVEYTAVVDPAVGAGSTQTNSADVDWESHPSSASRRVYNDGPNELAYTLDTDTATIQVADAVIAKTIEGGLTDRTIGEEFEYYLDFSIPASTTAYNMVITDYVPDGLTVLSATPSDAIGSLTVGAETAGVTPVSWNLGDATNPPYDTLRLTIKVRADGAFNGGSPVDGLPAGIDGDAQSTMLNTGAIDWDTADTGGTHLSSSDAVTITVIEPHLTIAKQVNAATAAASDTVTYTVSIENDGPATAHDLLWSDTVPAELFASGASPALSSITLDGTPLTSGTEYTASFGSSPDSSIDFDVPLASGSEILVTYTARLNGGLSRGDVLTNTARVDEYRSLPTTATGERVYGPITDTASVTVRAPEITIAKTRIGDAHVQRGQSADWQVVVTNSGDATAYSVVLTDTLPAGLTYTAAGMSWALPGPIAYTTQPVSAGQTHVWDFSDIGGLTLGAGESATLVFTSSVESTCAIGSHDNTATAGANDASGAPVAPDTASATIDVTRPHANITKQLATGQDPFVQVGQAGGVTYDLVVTNDGSTAIDTLPLSDVFESAYLQYSSASIAPAVAGGTLTWGDITGAGSLAAGATTTVTVNFDVIGHPADSSSDDTATIAGMIDTWGDVPPAASDTASISITAPSVSVNKTRTSSAPARIGDTVSFDISVTNSGDTTLTGIPLSDEWDSGVLSFSFCSPALNGFVPGTISWLNVTTDTGGPLAPGSSRTINCGFIATAATISTIDTATVSSAVDINGDTTALASDTATASIVAPDLTIDKSANRVLAGPGEVTTYTVTVANVGDGPAYDVVLSDAIPAPLFGAGDTFDVQLDGAPLAAGSDYSIGAIGPTDVGLTLNIPISVGSTLTVTYANTLAGGTPAGSALTDTATVESYSSLPGPNADEATWGPISDTWTLTTQAPLLAIDKSVVGDSLLQRGEDATYRVTVTNNGNAPAYSVVVTDTLPPGLDYVPGSAGASWSGAGSSTSDPSVTGATLVWDWTGSAYLEPGESLTLEYRANVTAGSGLGIKLNTAQTGANDGGGTPIAPATDFASLLVTLPGVSVSKQLASGQDPWIRVGESATFDYVISNSGDTTIAVLPLDEAYEAAYLLYTVGNASIEPDSAGAGFMHWDDLTTTLGDLVPGQVETVTVTFTAVGHPATSSTPDTITVTGAEDLNGDPIPVATDTRQIGITAPSVTISKTRTSAALTSPGETVSFDIVIRNTGDTTLAHVPLDDVYDDAALQFDSSLPVATTSGGGSIAWNDITASLGDIAPGAATTVTVEFIALDVAITTTNTASIALDAVLDEHNDRTGDVTASDDVRIDRPVLTIDKVADRSDLGPGDVATYTVTFTNTSGVPAVHAWFRDDAPAALGTPVAAPLVSFNGSPAAVSDYTVNPGTPFNIEFSRNIGPADTVTIEYGLMLAGGTPRGSSLTNTATVEWESAGGLTYGPVLDTHTMNTLAPLLSVTKVVVGDTELQRGEQATYLITLSNTGDDPAYAPVLVDTLPAGLTYVPGSSAIAWSGPTTASVDPTGASSVLTWSLPSAMVDPGDSLTLEFRASVDTDASFGLKTNSVEATAEDGGGGPYGPYTATADLLVTDPSVAVDKHLQPGQDPFVQVDEQVSFEIVVTNDGTTALDTVPLSDTYDAAYLSFASASPAADSTSTGQLNWTDLTGGGSLAIGQSTTVTVTFDVIGHPPTSSTLDTATVSSAVDEYGDTAEDATDTALINITEPRVSLSKTLAAGQDTVFAIGERVIYDIAVTNSGDSTLTTIPLVDTFDSTHLDYVTATPAPDAVGAATLSWIDITDAFGDLVPGQTTTLTAEFTVTAAGGSINNTATVPAGGDLNGDTATGSTAAQIVGAFAPGQIGFAKTADPVAGTIVVPGETITYSLTFTNSSDVTMPACAIRDELPETVTYLRDSITVSNGSTTTPVTDAATDDAGNFEPAAGPQGTIWVSLGDVAPDAVSTVSFSVTVRPEEFSRRGVRNHATLTSAGQRIGEAGPVDHPVNPLDIIKTGVDVNGGRLTPGDEIAWTITVTNTGLIPSTTTIITDVVPSETTYVVGSITGPGADASDAPGLVWQLGTLGVDESVTVSFRSRVNSRVASGTQIRNQAVVTSDQSTAKLSDAPETAAAGDETLLQTGGNDWIWLIGSLIALLLGAGLLLIARRRRAPQPPAAPMSARGRTPRYRPRPRPSRA